MGRIKVTEYGGQSEFLLDRNYTTEGYKFLTSGAYVTTNADGTKVVKAGTPIPANDNTCIGLALKDYDVTEDNFCGAIVNFGRVNKSKCKYLTSAIDNAAVAVLPRIIFE